MNKAPWPDYHGNEIHEGDVILHPTGERGVVVFLKDEHDPGDQWRVHYDDGPLSRLCLQIGDKGRARVAKRTTETPLVSLPARPHGVVRADPPPGEIHFCVPLTGAPMLRISPDGFWVRGEKVPQGEGEAKAVYDAFVSWLRATGHRV